MRPLTVAGLSADGRTLLLTGGDETFAVPIAAVHAAQQIRLPDIPEPARPAPTPREIQRRIRHGESAADIARTSGAPVEAVARYEGPALAEREHQARLARLTEVDGRVVADLVAEHMVRVAQHGQEIVWDSWLTDSGRWEVRAVAGRELVRLSWDPRARRVNAVDEPGRQALRLGPIAEDALGAVLRPLSGRTQPAAAPRASSEQGQGAGAGLLVVPGDGEQPGTVTELRAAEPAHEVSTGASPDSGPPMEGQPSSTGEPLRRPAPAPPRRPSSGRRGRAQVPGWDQITMAAQDRRGQPAGSEPARRREDDQTGDQPPAEDRRAGRPPSPDLEVADQGDLPAAEL